MRLVLSTWLGWLDVFTSDSLTHEQSIEIMAPKVLKPRRTMAILWVKDTEDHE